MPIFPSHDTPQGKTYLQSLDKRLLQRLAEQRNDVLAQIDSWAQFRRESVEETRFEGLKGRHAVYHLADMARYLNAAANELMVAEGVKRSSRSPRDALAHLAKGYGWRFLRGVRGLQDALQETGISEQGIAKFVAEREKAQRTLLAQLDAAYLVNSSGRYPELAIDAVRAFAKELLIVCDWLELVSEFGLARLVVDDVDAALHKLSDAEKSLRVTRKMH
jgi:hypothetical protein